MERVGCFITKNDGLQNQSVLYGDGKPTTKQIEEAADRWTFLVKELGMK